MTAGTAGFATATLAAPFTLAGVRAAASAAPSHAGRDPTTARTSAGLTVLSIVSRLTDCRFANAPGEKAAPALSVGVDGALPTLEVGDGGAGESAKAPGRRRKERRAERGVPRVGSLSAGLALSASSGLNDVLAGANGAGP